MRNGIVALLVTVGLPFATAVGRQTSVPTNVLAKAGELFITEREFLQRYELLPAPGRPGKTQVEEAKLKVLYSLIAEKLLAQEAQARLLDRDSAALSSLEEVRKMLARDQLYREEVQAKVRVSDAEVNQGISEAQREILISFLFFEKKEDAGFVRKQFRSGRDFDRMDIDSVIGAVRDTATVIWSDADPAVERAAYQLKPGQVSDVVRAGTGYYILKVERMKRSAFYTSLQPSVLKERVLLKLRERKERLRLNEFMATALKDRVGYARPGPFKQLGMAIENSFSRISLSGKTALSEKMVEEIRNSCQKILRDTLAVAGRRIWTVGETLEGLYSKGFSVDSLSVKALPSLLNSEVRVWVQQELLAQEALDRRLDQRPEVRAQLDVWYQSILSQWMKLTVHRQQKVSEPEVLSFLQTTDTGFVVPRVRIRELRTASLDDMQQALMNMENGKSLEEVIMRWCSEPELRRRKGISDAFPVSERSPIGELAWQMSPGQRMGPLRDSTGYIYFELLTKENSPTASDTAYTTRLARAKKELLRQKEKRAVTMFLAQIGQKRGFEVYSDRLKTLEVSRVPMMTFRILGFGGRMFTVPFVDPQIEWINITPSSEQIVF